MPTLRRKNVAALLCRVRGSTGKSKGAYYSRRPSVRMRSARHGVGVPNESRPSPGGFAGKSQETNRGRHGESIWAQKDEIMRAALALVMAMSAHTQQQPAPRVEFEVVSVKPGDPASQGSSSGTPAGRLVMRNTTLKNLVMSAYRLNEYEIAGGPTWMDSAKFN